MKLIDKDALVAEIERLVSNGKLKCQQSQENNDQASYIAWSEHIATCGKILSFIDTLEVKEDDKYEIPYIKIQDSIKENNMKQEDKELLLKYLCMALPYRMAIKDDCGDTIFLDYNDVHIQNYFEGIVDGVVRPYLRPMSSMTEEELKEFYDVECMDAKVGYIKPTWNWHFTINGIDWLLKNHFDFMGLIPKGLAIEVTKENNPY